MVQVGGFPPLSLLSLSLPLFLSSPPPFSLLLLSLSLSALGPRVGVGETSGRRSVAQLVHSCGGSFGGGEINMSKSPFSSMRLVESFLAVYYTPQVLFIRQLPTNFGAITVRACNKASTLACM